MKRNKDSLVCVKDLTYDYFWNGGNSWGIDSCPECGGILKVIEKGKHVHCTKCDWGEDNRNVVETDKEKDIVLKPEETDDYIRIPVRDCKVTATITISADEGIKALYCGKIKKIRTYLFAKAMGGGREKK